MTLKNFSTTDVYIQQRELNRLYNFSDSTTSSFGVSVFEIRSASFELPNWTSSFSQGIYTDLLWHNIRSTYFQHEINPQQTVLPVLQSTASVMVIPEYVIGEGIKQKSILVTNDTTNETFRDQPVSDLGVFYSGTIAVGLVDYRNGVLVMTDPSQSFSNFTCNLRNRMLVTEHRYYCRIGKSEFNMSLNPTAMSGSLDESQSFVPAGFCSHSAWSPYITSIGLYNQLGELIATANMSQPIKKPTDYELTIICEYDT